jgi:hypothetical protein
VVGAWEGLPGVTEGVPVTGVSVGVMLGDPGVTVVTVGPGVSVGVMLGDPGVTVVTVGPDVVGAMEGLPDVTEGVPVTGA